MSDDLFSQVQANAGPAAWGGILGTVASLFAVFNVFAKHKDVDQKVEMAELKSEKKLADFKTEVAEKYMTKEALEPMQDDIRYIRERIDNYSDRK